MSVFHPELKRLFACAALCMLTLLAKADHITGGEMYYTSSVGSNGEINYNVTLKLFMRCNSGRQFNNPAVVSIFRRGTNQRVKNIDVLLSKQETIQLNDAGPCITNPPSVCYVIGTYIFNISLPASADGYVLASQVNFRISGISNMTVGYSNIGATYTSEIPGTAAASNGPSNNSAQFTGNDLVVVCANNRFSYSFGATDPDGDELRYSFCDAYASGASSIGNSSAPPPDPPYQSVPYGAGFNGSEPLGPEVRIDNKTGLITGIAPPTGIYVVTVCVQEVRNGVVIAVQRKDLQINIAACDIAGAVLQPEYQLCRNSYTLTLNNQSTSNLIKTQNWEIRNAQNAKLFETSNQTLNYTFADTGLYTVKLVINRGQSCTDSTLSLIRVYPGFKPAFSFSGICFSKPTNFFNASTTVYGSVKSVSWDFGEAALINDTSTQANPVYTYTTTGSKIAVLTATNTNGCKDTANRVVPIFTRPPLNLAFADTLICLGDSVQLKAQGMGIYKWTPVAGIAGSNSNTPTASPAATTKYYVDLDDQGCLNRDSVVVRVTDHVDLQMMSDTTICQGDAITLKIASNAFKYSWTPSSQIENANVANPTVTTVTNTVYRLTANIGSCEANGQIAVSTVPYPLAKAGADTMLCYNTTAQLNGSTDGVSVKWAPAAYLSNSNILSPQATPPQTTTYVMYAYDTKGCPKPGVDSVTVTVLPEIHAFAGNDTTVVVGQDLHLLATGGTAYQWFPTLGLSASNINAPVVRFTEETQNIRYFVYVYNQAGCVDTASVGVKVFSTLPGIFVPTAFTPNNDGRNDVLRPIAAGIKSMEYFSVFNRWGKLVFTTSQPGVGWDGTISGVPQPSGTFVWMVKAVDYLDKPYVRKGTVVLIK